MALSGSYCGLSVAVINLWKFLQQSLERIGVIITMKTLSTEQIKDISTQIKRIADDIYDGDNHTDFEFGQMLVLCEVLTIIQDTVDSEFQKEIGLDFDVSEKYIEQWRPSA